MVVGGLEPKGAFLPTHSINLFDYFSNPMYNSTTTMSGTEGATCQLWFYLFESE